MSGSMAPADSLQGLCAWIDQVPLSRPKRSLSRDLSDGVMVAEIVKHFLPKLVEMHNYVPANSTQQKLSNWSTLNRKVFSKLNFQVSVEDVRKLVANSPDVVEPILSTLRQKIEEKLQEKALRDRPGKPAKIYLIVNANYEIRIYTATWNSGPEGPGLPPELSPRSSTTSRHGDSTKTKARGTGRSKAPKNIKDLG